MRDAAPQKTNGAGRKPAIRWATQKKSDLPLRGRKERRPATRRDKMLADLARSGLDEHDAKRMGCKSVSGERAKGMLGLTKVNLPDGIIIPYHDIEGRKMPNVFRWRALGDYTQRNRQTGKQEPGPKYRQARGSEPHLYFPPSIDWSEPHDRLVLTEGEKKAAAACKLGIPTVGIGGVYSWKVPQSDPDQLLPEFDHILDDDVTIEICFDSDLETNPNVRQALARFAAVLEKDGCHVQVVYLPSGEDGDKVGLDDFLVAAGTRPDGTFSRKRARRAFEKLPRNDPPTIDPLRIRTAADILPQPIRPIWPDVLYQGKVSLVAGEPGLGKSLLTCDVASRVSRGLDWPGGSSSVIEPSNVVMISGEDDAEDTIIPRLMAAGADLARIAIIDDVIEKRGGELSPLSLDQHSKSVHDVMVRSKAKLLVVDPVSAFMGGQDSHKDTAVRALINKLRQYAAEGGYSVLLITHFNKPGEKVTSAVHRVMGSLGFVAAARSVYAFVRDPMDPERRIFLPIKNNLGPDKEGFGCDIEVDHSQNLRPPPVRLRWEADVVQGERIDEILAQASPREQTRMAKKQEVGKWLDRRLKRGKRVRATKFNEDVRQQGYSERLVRELMPQHGYRKVQEGFPAKWWVVRENVQ